MASAVGFRNGSNGGMEMSADLVSRTKERLETEFYRMNDDWLEGCVQFYVTAPVENPKNNTELLKFVKEQWLLSDLREICNARGCLPANLQQQKAIVLRSTYILQMEAMHDISRPRYEQLEEIRNNRAAKARGKPARPSNVEATQDAEEAPRARRTMSLKLTDGVQDVVGMEYRQIRRLNDTLLPGSKLMIIGPVHCRRGVLLLEEGNVKSVGGEVDKLLVRNAPENLFARALGFPENPDPYNDVAPTKAGLQELDDLEINPEDFDDIDFPELQGHPPPAPAAATNPVAARVASDRPRDAGPGSNGARAGARCEARAPEVQREGERGLTGSGPRPETQMDVIELSDFEDEDLLADFNARGEPEVRPATASGGGPEASRAMAGGSAREPEAPKGTGNAVGDEVFEIMDMQEFFEDFEPEVRPSKATEPEAKQFKVKEPEVKQLKAKEPEVTQLKTKEPEAKQFKVKEPEVKQLKTKEPEVKQLKTKEPEAKQFRVKEPEVKQFQMKEPGVRRPEASPREPEVAYEELEDLSEFFGDILRPAVAGPQVNAAARKPEVGQIPGSKPEAGRGVTSSPRQKPEVARQRAGNMTMDGFLRKDAAEANGKRPCDPQQSPIGSSPKRGRTSEPLEPDLCQFIGQIRTMKAGEATVRGKVDEIGKLGKKDNAWTLDAVISDGSGSLDVCFSNEVLENILGFSVQEFARRKKMKTDPRVEHELRMSLRGAEQKLKNLDARLNVAFSAAKPCVTNIAELTEEQKSIFQTRLKRHMQA